jgi:hypothetical protein
METEFPAGLTRVKAETLSGSGSGSRVRSGPGRVTELRQKSYPGVVGLAELGRIISQVTGLRRFSYPGAIRLAGLSPGKAKTSPQAGFSLIPQPGLG